MKALCRAIVLSSFVAVAGCSGRIAAPGSVTPSDAIVASGLSSATSTTTSVRQTDAFSPPAQQPPPAYQAQTFDIYQQPDDIYQQPDDIYQQPDGIIIVPHGQTPPPYPDGTIPVPLPGGYVYWPDGSVQIAGSDGSFTPAQSSYAQANAGQIEADPWGGVAVTIADPSGVDQPVSATLPASTLDPGTGGAGGREFQTDAVAVRTLGASTANAAAPDIAALTVVPAMVEARDGAALPLTAGALNFDGHAASLGGAPVTWTQPAAGKIVPIGDGRAALYYAPKSGTGIDRFTASIGGFTAGGAVAYYGRESLAQVDATLVEAPAGATLGFAQTGNLPAPLFQPPVWFAHARAGRFFANLPQGATYQAFVTLGAPRPGRYAATGEPNLSVAQAATAALSLQATAAQYALATGLAVPPVATDIRDAVVVSRLVRGRNLFDAGSGLQPLLAAGSGRGAVPSGEYAGWLYEWQNQSGVPALVLLEASAGAPGTRSATIVPAGDGATFHFTSYRSAGALAAAFPLAAVQPGSQLVESGSWSQSAKNGTFAATLAIDRYDAAHQTPGSPLYTERGNYSAGTGGAASFAGMKLYDANGLLLWAYDATQSAAHGAGPSAVRSFGATLTRAAPTASGTPVKTRWQLNGHGSSANAHVSLANADGSATIEFDLAATPRGESLSNGTLARGSLGIAQFAVDGGGNVTATVGADAASGFPGTQLAFPL